MRSSKLFGKTSRQIPAEADTISHQLLLRAGMIQQIAAGVYAYLPLAWRVVRKIENIIRDELDNVGAQELHMPALQPIELWQKSGRYASFGQTLFTVADRKERQLVLGATHEEVITDLVHRFVQSYRDLPLLLYQLQTKFRDEPRPRGGLLRVREFIMKDLYSFDVDETGLDLNYDRMIQAYRNIYRRCGLNVVLVEADSGAIGGKASHEFMVITPTGEDSVVSCSRCDYAANVEKARLGKGDGNKSESLPLEQIATPNAKSIVEVTGLLGVKPDQTLKVVFYSAEGELIVGIVRGDFEVNETKLRNVLKYTELRLATDAEIREHGLVPGFASPVGLKGNGIRVIGDDSIKLGANFVAGANRQDTHLKNVNYPRDFQVETIVDIAQARPGDRCVFCGSPLSTNYGIEVGHVFKLGIFLSEKLEALYLDSSGTSHPIVMGCYGIGVGRLLAAVVEQNHDDKGILWPMPIAPFQVHLCPLYMDNAEVKKAAESLYLDLTHAGVEVLIDDREESPGVKFNDADLMGIPLRLTLSRRTLDSGSVEVKWRYEKQPNLRPLEEIVGWVSETIAASLQNSTR